MSNLKNLWARILATIGGECAALGFEKRGSASYTKCIHVDVIGVVSFAGDRSEDGKLVVMPSVAVRNHTLEHLLTELIGEKPNPFGSGTLACTLGHVPPNSQLSWFYFSDDENPGPPDLRAFSNRQTNRAFVDGATSTSRFIYQGSSICLPFRTPRLGPSEASSRLLPKGGFRSGTIIRQPRA
jgi:hypothetical protein